MPFLESERRDMKTAAIGLGALLAVAPAFAQQQQPKFDVADVHVSPTAPGFGQNFGGVPREGHYVNRDATMLELIEAAYGTSEDMSGGPGWMSLDLFDVIAKVPDGTTSATANLMLQSLLADRFGLVTSHGARPVPRYVMTVAKGGLKLKTTSGSGAPSCQPVQQPAGAAPADLASAPNIKVVCHNFTAGGIADQLRQMAGGYLDHDVVDSTKLEGTWDFDLEWTPRQALTAKGADGISLFDGAEKPLGLKLELQNVPTESFVVERVNRKPRSNPNGIEAKLAPAAARARGRADQTCRSERTSGGSQMRAGGTLRKMIAMALQVSPNLG